MEQDTDPSEFKKNFWCEKYFATVHYFTNPPDWEEKAWPRPPFGVLFGADEELWSATHEKLDAQERGDFATPRTWRRRQKSFVAQRVSIE